MNFIFAPNMILILKYIKDPEGFWRQKILCVQLDVDDLQKLSTPTPWTMTQLMDDAISHNIITPPPPTAASRLLSLLLISCKLLFSQPAMFVD